MWALLQLPGLHAPSGSLRDLVSHAPLDRLTFTRHEETHWTVSICRPVKHSEILRPQSARSESTRIHTCTHIHTCAHGLVHTHDLRISLRS